MITPFRQTQRGNSITAARIRSGLTDCGYDISLLSLDEDRWQEHLGTSLAKSEYGLLHGFHAWHLGRVLRSLPLAAELPIILTTTGTDIHLDLRNDRRSTVLAAMQAAAKIVVFHDSFKPLVTREYPPAADKIVTIPQAVSIAETLPDKRSKWGFGADEIIFFLPSGLRPVKNISLAIDALSQLHPQYPQLRLAIIGADLDTNYSRPLLARIRTLPWISYLGEIPHEEIGSLLALGDVVLNTSLAEGQPQAVLEAMSLGLPCIMTAVPGNLDLITDGLEGFYAQGEPDLCQAAQKLLDDTALRRQMGDMARQLIASRYAPYKEIDAYHRLYHQILGF